MNPNPNQQGFIPPQGGSFGMEGSESWSSFSSSSANPSVDPFNHDRFHSQTMPHWVPQHHIPPPRPARPPIWQDPIGTAGQTSRASSRGSSNGPALSRQTSRASSRGLATGLAHNQGAFGNMSGPNSLANPTNGAVSAENKTVITSLDDCPDFWNMSVAELYDWQRFVDIQDQHARDFFTTALKKAEDDLDRDQSNTPPPPSSASQRGRRQQGRTSSTPAPAAEGAENKQFRF
ncbi:uncharacterized protein MELLADRAFT_117030, partial [Melampsora larici-populina 98AG31]